MLSFYLEHDYAKQRYAEDTII